MNTAIVTLCTCFLLALVHVQVAVSVSSIPPTTITTVNPANSASITAEAATGGSSVGVNAVSSSSTPATVAKVGETCTAGQCQNQSTCNLSTSKCEPVPRAVGGACKENETQSDCLDKDGSECKTGKCQCKSGYNNSKDSLTCTKNGSAAVFGSILVMAVAFLTTRLD